MIKSLNEFLQNTVITKKPIVAIAQASDLDMLEIAALGNKHNLANFILIGDKIKIQHILDENNYVLDNIQIIHCIGDKECSELAIKLVHDKVASLPMKGLLPTATFMKAVLDKNYGLRSNTLISQISITNNIDETQLSFITDCALNMNPTLSEKSKIIENAVSLAISLGYSKPKVAIITALETVNESMPETLDAAILSKMADRGQIKNCFIDGPFALDNAISLTSASHKNISGSVAGQADILLMSDIKMGNVLHKSLTYYAKKQVASIIVGTTSPIILTSRSDSPSDKLLSILISEYYNQNKQLLPLK